MLTTTVDNEVTGRVAFAKIDVELLAANKRIVNLGLELMGARTLQRLAAENDARGHQTPSARTFTKTAVEKGLKEAIRERDAKFGDGRARVNGPEIRDERGFLIEDEDAMAARQRGTLEDVEQFHPARSYGEYSVQVAMFNYLIGNTDWAVVRPRRGEEWCCHNSIPVGTFVGPVLPLPFDFDWSGLVNAPYARPNERLGIRSVRERRFWGICRPREELEAAFPIFNERRQDIYDLFRNQQDLDPRYLEEAVEYLDEFYDVINDPDEVTREMMRECRS